MVFFGDLRLFTAFAPAIISTVLFLSACCSNESIPENTKKLHSGAAKERNQAALDLARCGDAAAKAVPRLGQLLYDENVGVQSSAAYALRQIDTKDARAILEAAERARKRK